MNNSNKFEELSEFIRNLQIDEQRKILYYVLGETKEIMDKENISKSDILTTYENAVTNFGKRERGKK